MFMALVTLTSVWFSNGSTCQRSCMKGFSCGLCLPSPLSSWKLQSVVVVFRKTWSIYLCPSSIYYFYSGEVLDVCCLSFEWMPCADVWELLKTSVREWMTCLIRYMIQEWMTCLRYMIQEEEFNTATCQMLLYLWLWPWDW